MIIAFAMSISMMLILAEVRQLCLMAKLRVWSRVKSLAPVPSLWCIEVLLILSVRPTFTLYGSCRQRNNGATSHAACTPCNQRVPSLTCRQNRCALPVLRRAVLPVVLRLHGHDPCSPITHASFISNAIGTHGPPGRSLVLVGLYASFNRL